MISTAHRRFDGLLPCPCCGGRPLVLVIPHGGRGTAAVRIECGDCKISTPAQICGGSVAEYDKAAHAVAVRTYIDLREARATCAEIWNKRASASG